MMELYAEHFHFLGDTPKQQRQDFCIHGSVFLRIGDNIISGGDDDEWCVSASALRFLRSLYNNHISGKEEQMIPCCGHFMVLPEREKCVEIVGCPNGIDFDVIRKGDEIIIRWDKTEIIVPYSEYKNAVIAYAQQIIDFYNQNDDRLFDDEYDKKIFKAFLDEFLELYNKAK